MNQRLILAPAGLLFLLPLLGFAQQHDEPATDSADGASPSVQAQRAYLDPATGRLTDTPPLGAEVLTLSPEELNSISTSHEGLVQEPHPSGWVVIDLQGRFQHMAVATVAEDGSVAVREVSGEAFLPTEAPKPQSEDNQ